MWTTGLDVRVLLNEVLLLAEINELTMVGDGHVFIVTMNLNLFDTNRHTTITILWCLLAGRLQDSDHITRHSTLINLGKQLNTVE